MGLFTLHVTHPADLDTHIGVVVEHLVELFSLEQQDTVGVLCLEIPPLPLGGCGFAELQLVNVQSAGIMVWMQGGDFTSIQA